MADVVVRRPPREAGNDDQSGEAYLSSTRRDVHLTDKRFIRREMDVGKHVNFLTCVGVLNGA